MEGWEQALELQAQLLRQIDGPNWVEAVGTWLANREDSYGRQAMLPSAAAFQVAREIVANGNPIFITEEMMDLTLSAMETFDPKERVIPEDFFFTDAVVLLERPLVVEDSEGHATKWHAVTWRFTWLPPEADPDGIEQPALEIIIWWDVTDTDGWDDAHPEISERAKLIWSQWGMRYAPMHATLVPLDYMHQDRHMSQEGDPEARWLTFVRVLNRLMEMKIVLKSPMRPQRGIRRGAQRAGLTEIKDVIVCELRRARPRGYEWPETEGGTHYTHRFRVVGHWRRQWYPSEGRHKQIRIESYIKGPDDKPFIDKKRAWVWDR